MAIKIPRKPRKPSAKKSAAAPTEKPAPAVVVEEVAPEPVVEPVVAAPPAQPAGEAAAPIVETEAPADDRRHAQGGGRSRGHALGGRGRRSK